MKYVSKNGAKGTFTTEDGEVTVSGFLVDVNLNPDGFLNVRGEATIRLAVVQGTFPLEGMVEA